MRGETAAVSRAALPEKFEIAAPEFAWRVLRLINVFRTLAAVFLLAMFLLAEEPRLIGNTHPELFFVTALAYFVFGALNDFAVTQRWPSLLGQSVGQALPKLSSRFSSTRATRAWSTARGLFMRGRRWCLRSAGLVRPRRAG